MKNIKYTISETTKNTNKSFYKKKKKDMWNVCTINVNIQ